ncbi:MAG TPA: hypothetical protein VM582_06960 [Candidatus Thermoplasmatota archaeon]|nr:hypothetical protein [Candidatus Thermoplasmatota archaeon]
MYARKKWVVVVLASLAALTLVPSGNALPQCHFTLEDLLACLRP